jgi:DNA-binding NtrC family response regulator
VKNLRSCFQKEGEVVSESILIIDDDEDMLKTLSDVLQEKGYRIETTKTGKEGIMTARDWFFDIALIDLKLPDMSGITVLKIFQLKYPSMIKIIITGYAALQNAVDAMNIGANAYIMKPIDHERLIQLIGYKELINTLQ